MKPNIICCILTTAAVAGALYLSVTNGQRIVALEERARNTEALLKAYGDELSVIGVTLSKLPNEPVAGS